MPTQKQLKLRRLQRLLKEQTGLRAFIRHIAANKLDFATWLAKLLATHYSLRFLLNDDDDAYYASMVPHAIAEIIRIFQILPNLFLPLYFLAPHVLFSVIFTFSRVIGIAILPVLLHSFASTLVNSVIYIEILMPCVLDLEVGNWIFYNVVSFAVKLLRFTIYVKIFLLPMLCVLCYLGRARVHLFVVILYLLLIVCDYWMPPPPCENLTRDAFHSMRIKAEKVANFPLMPWPISALIHKMIQMVSLFAPDEVPLSLVEMYMRQYGYQSRSDGINRQG